MSYTNGLDKPTDYFNTLLYTGNGSSSHGVTGVGFTQNWTWIKERSQTENHFLFDTVRGDNKYVNSNTTDKEYTESGGMAFNSDGFTLGSWNSVNENNQTYASWNWKAGTSFTNDASATGIGSIDSTGSVNTDAGFSIISYTGTGSAGTVAHGLGVAPKMIIIKNRSQSNGWITGHEKLDATNTWHKYVELHSTNGVGDLNTIWNDTAPTSSLFTVGTEGAVNNSGNNFIAYCFAEKQGFSKFGSYTGNGNADGTFVYTGFKPAFVMVKRTDSTGNWVMVDSKRDTFNVCDAVVSADISDSEYDIDVEDFVSNGFKMRDNHSTRNASGGSYIYMCFAENPFVTSTGVCATAR